MGLVDVRQTEIDVAETLVAEPSASEFKVATDKFKMYKSPAFITSQLKWFKEEVGDYAAELIQAWGSILCCRTDSSRR